MFYLGGVAVISDHGKRFIVQTAVKEVVNHDSIFKVNFNRYSSSTFGISWVGTIEIRDGAN
jgi:hypothetical protein